MKMFKKLAAVVLSLALVAVMANGTVKAAISTSMDNAEMRGSDFYFDCLAQGLAADAYGARITFTIADESQGFGGGFIFNSSADNWNSMEWGNADAGKALSAVSTGNAGEYTVERLSDAPIFAADEAQWAEIAVQQWWGGDIVITNVEMLNADGSVLGAVAEEAAVETTEAVAETTAAVDETPKTGDSSNVVYIIVIMGIAAAAIVVEKFVRKQKSC